VLAFEDERQLAIHASQDIWSLGVIAYTVLTQKEVFGETDSLDWISQFAHGKLSYPWEEGPKQAAVWKDCPAKGVFEHCLSRDPTKRPTSATLVRAISAFVGANSRKPFMV
jgi:serine/threonine protein kinase